MVCKLGCSGIAVCRRSNSQYMAIKKTFRRCNLPGLYWSYFSYTCYSLCTNEFEIFVLHVANVYNFFLQTLFENFGFSGSMLAWCFVNTV